MIDVSTVANSIAGCVPGDDAGTLELPCTKHPSKGLCVQLRVDDDKLHAASLCGCKEAELLAMLAQQSPLVAKILRVEPLEPLKPDHAGQVANGGEQPEKTQKIDGSTTDDSGQATAWQANGSSNGHTVNGGVPFLITQEMRARLREMGHNDEAIAKLTPAQAWGILHPADMAKKRPDVNDWKAMLYEFARQGIDGVIKKGPEYREFVAAMDLATFTETVQRGRNLPGNWLTHDPEGLSESEIEEEIDVIARAVQKKYGAAVVERQQPTPKEPPIKPLPMPQKAGQWMAQEEERYANLMFIWEGILEAGGISIITGKKGNGKSTFTRSLALSIARGLPILGRNTERSKVWYIDLEPGGRGRLDVWRKLGWCDDDDLEMSTLPPVANRPDAIAWLKDNIVSHGYKLVVIDTMFKMIRVDGANDYDKGVYAQIPLEEIARETNVHFILIHHARKNQMSEAQSVAEAILGSTSIAGAACACILINRRRDTFTFRMDPPRYGEAIEGETVLELDDTGAIRPAGSWRKKWVNQSKDATMQAALAKPDWFTARELEIIDDDTGERMKLRSIQWALNALADDGKLDRKEGESATKRGRPPLLFKIKVN